MIRRLLRSRGSRRFFRNRLAVGALVIITVYFLAALFVFFGGVSARETNLRVLPDRTPGTLLPIKFDTSYRNARWFYNTVSSARDRIRASGLDDAELSDAESIINQISLAERKVRADSMADFIAKAEGVEQAWDEFDETLPDLEEYRDWKLANTEDIKDLREEDTPEAREKIAELTAELRDEVEPELARFEHDAQTALDAFYARLNELMPTPDGLEGLSYKFKVLLGSDSQGRSISVKGLYSVKIAFQIGLVTSVVSVLLGTLLGAAAGFFGGWIDAGVMWLVSTLSSIPYLVMLAVLIFVVSGSKLFDNAAENPGMALVPVYAAFCLTFWIGTCRVIRGEVMKLKELEYVQAATAIGFARPYILLRHVVPNTAHLMFINFSLLFIGAIKAEVILSFLGFGVKGQPSWGIMISQGKEDVLSFFFWEVLTATFLMFGLVLAFNIVSDALQDAFDPKHVG